MIGKREVMRLEWNLHTKHAQHPGTSTTYMTNSMRMRAVLTVARTYLRGSRRPANASVLGGAGVKKG